MGSLHDTEFADSPSMVLPPPNVHSFYASAHSHCIPHYQATKPSTHSSSRPRTLLEPSTKRSRESLENESVVSRSKVPKTSPQFPDDDMKALGHAAGGADGMVGGQAKETADQDVEMSCGDTVSSNIQNGTGDSQVEGLSVPEKDGMGASLAQKRLLPEESSEQMACSRAASCLAVDPADSEIVDDIVEYRRSMRLERVLRESTSGDGSVVLQGPVTACRGIVRMDPGDFLRTRGYR
ncbi:MAG: hypothetical protein Q9192_004168 [Flavoplaca navasiana]